MIGVTQIRMGYGQGQCTEASLASLLELPLDAVPDLWAGPGVPPDAPPEAHQPMERCEALWRWLREERGVVWCEARFPMALPLEAIAPSTVRGVVGSILPHVDDLDAPWVEHHILFGPNISGVGHCVVGRYGRVVWDPNPHRVGIVACEGMIFLVPVALCPSDLPLAARWNLSVQS